MPTAVTYNSLLETIPQFVERGMVTDEVAYENLPLCINNAERNIINLLNVIGVKRVVVGTMTTGNSVIDKPEDFRRVTSINFGVPGVGVDIASTFRTPMFPRSYEYCRTYWNDESQTAEPKFYADYNDDHWLFVPTPDQDYNFELIYSAKPTLLDSTNQTNWLTENWPNLLLYAAIAEFYLFAKNKEEAGVWDAKFKEVLAGINEDDMKKIIDRGTSRQEA